MPGGQDNNRQIVGGDVRPDLPARLRLADGVGEGLRQVLKSGRQAGAHEDTSAAGVPYFYMFDPMKPEADEAWSDAATTYPGFLYWSSGSHAPEDRWDPFDGKRAMQRKAPMDVPSWADPEDVAYAVGAFQPQQEDPGRFNAALIGFLRSPEVRASSRP